MPASLTNTMTGRSSMPMSPIERRAAFRAAVILKQTTMTRAAASLGISYNHLVLVLAGNRRASRRLQSAVATFLEVSIERVFEPRRESES